MIEEEEGRWDSWIPQLCDFEHLGFNICKMYIRSHFLIFLS